MKKKKTLKPGANLENSSARKHKQQINWLDWYEDKILRTKVMREINSDSQESAMKFTIVYQDYQPKPQSETELGSSSKVWYTEQIFCLKKKEQNKYEIRPILPIQRIQTQQMSYLSLPERKSQNEPLNLWTMREKK